MKSCVPFVISCRVTRTAAALVISQILMNGDAVAGSDAPGRHATDELRNLRPLSRAIEALGDAVEDGDLEVARIAAERYDAVWNAIEVYVNVRSFPLYIDMEVDTQDAIEDELKEAVPNFKKLSKLVNHLQYDFKTVHKLAAASPDLSPLFDDVAKIRKVRANLRLVNEALASADLDKAKDHFDRFSRDYENISSLLVFRSKTAEADTFAALGEVDAQFSRQPSDIAVLSTAVTKLLARYNYALSLHNAAARTADLHKTGPSEDDKTQLRYLQQLEFELSDSLSHYPGDATAAARKAGTGPDSTFAKVQPALEAKARFVNTAAILRSAIASYAKLLETVPPPAIDEVKNANLRAIEAIELARHTLVGQFWEDKALQDFLHTLSN